MKNKLNPVEFIRLWLEASRPLSKITEVQGFFKFFILILHYVESKSWNNQNRNKFGRCWQKIWLKKLYKYLNKKGYGVIIHSLALYILKLNRSLLFEGDIKGFRCLGKDCTVLSWYYFYPWILPLRYRLKASFITKLDLIWQNVFWQNMFVNAKYKILNPIPTSQQQQEV